MPTVSGTTLKIQQENLRDMKRQLEYLREMYATLKLKYFNANAEFIKTWKEYEQSKMDNKKPIR